MVLVCWSHCLDIAARCQYYAECGNSALTKNVLLYIRLLPSGDEITVTSHAPRQLYCKLPLLGLRNLSDLESPLAGAAHHVACLQHRARLCRPPVDPSECKDKYWQCWGQCGESDRPLIEHCKTSERKGVFIDCTLQSFIGSADASRPEYLTSPFLMRSVMALRLMRNPALASASRRSDASMLVRRSSRGAGTRSSDKGICRGCTLTLRTCAGDHQAIFMSTRHADAGALLQAARETCHKSWQTHCACYSALRSPRRSLSQPNAEPASDAPR